MSCAPACKVTQGTESLGLPNLITCVYLCMFQGYQTRDGVVIEVAVLGLEEERSSCIETCKQQRAKKIKIFFFL